MVAALAEDIMQMANTVPRRDSLRAQLRQLHNPAAGDATAITNTGRERRADRAAGSRNLRRFLFIAGRLSRAHARSAALMPEGPQRRLITAVHNQYRCGA